MASPAATGFLMTAVNGHPPHMIDAQNVTITEAMVHMISMGEMGRTPPPTVKKYAANDDQPADRGCRQCQEQRALDRLSALGREAGLLAAPSDPDHDFHRDDAYQAIRNATKKLRRGEERDKTERDRNHQSGGDEAEGRLFEHLMESIPAMPPGCQGLCGFNPPPWD